MDREFCEGSFWGFTVIRPSTLSATEEQWANVLSSIRKDVGDYLRYEHGTPLEPDDMDSSLHDFKLIVLDLEMPQDASTSGVADNTMITAARLRYEEWLRATEEFWEKYWEQKEVNHAAPEDLLRGLTLEDYGPRDFSQRGSVLLVDAESMESILNPSTEWKFLPWVLVIDPHYQPMPPRLEDPNDRYIGWMRTRTQEILRLWELRVGEEMSRWCPKTWVDGQIPVFTEVGPEYVNPPGVEIPRRLGTRRGIKRTPSLELEYREWARGGRS